jgi:hypothetical protein
MRRSTLGAKSGFLAVLLGIAILVAPAYGQVPVSAASLESTPAVATVDATVEMQRLASPEIHQSFPRLQLKYVEVLGPSTRQYNCIAHSLGVNRWVNPETGDAQNPLAPMDRMYGELGYVREPEMNFALEPGKQKVVLYAALNPDATIRNVTHAARQEPDGTWTSKLGSLSLIRHATPEALRGPTYGTPIAVYVRTVSPNTL